MIQVAAYNTLSIIRIVEIGAYLEDGNTGLLLPKRYVPAGADVGDSLTVFVYHDGEDRLIATTQAPLATVHQIAHLKCVGTTAQGAFLDWGLMKDIFVPKSQQKSTMYQGEYYFVKIYIDAQTGRAAATEKIDHQIINQPLTVTEQEQVQVTIYRETNIGYVCIINHLHQGVLHYSDVFSKVHIGNVYNAFIKKIYADTNHIDLVLGTMGYAKVDTEAAKILQLLQEHNGYLPYHDKSSPEAIQDYFGMSKKVFKMTIGKLYKEKKIELTTSGIKLVI